MLLILLTASQALKQSNAASREKHEETMEVLFLQQWQAV
jgi:hypothetical protein